jgi:hypothetical protein
MRNCLDTTMTKADAKVAMTGAVGIAIGRPSATKTTKTP